MRALVRAVFGLVLRVFFRRIEIAGVERVPADGAVLFVLNHPNALIDPAVLLCHAPRSVSFLAKAPLFRMPVIGLCCRALDAIPVHRREDEGAHRAHNRETFETARAVLSRGGAIAIFPEGTSHSDSQLRPLKTGAARIALGAAGDGAAPIRIVPTGLYYRAKGIFRSAALLYFGAPFPVEPVALAPGEEPPAAPVRALTDQIERALAEVTLQAERAEALALVARAQRILAVTDTTTPTPPPLAEEFALRRRLLAGYQAAQTHWPERSTALAIRIERYEAALNAAGLDPAQLVPGRYTVGLVARYVARAALFFLVLLPAALVGLALHYPAYRAVGLVAAGLAKGAEDALASVKVLAAMLLFPLTWGVFAVVLWRWRGVAVALAWLPLGPLMAYAALRFTERLDKVVGAARALGLFAFRRWAFLRLVAERTAIRDEVQALGRELEGAAAS